MFTLKWSSRGTASKDQRSVSLQSLFHSWGTKENRSLKHWCSPSTFQSKIRWRESMKSSIHLKTHRRLKCRSQFTTGETWWLRLWSDAVLLMFYLQTLKQQQSATSASRFCFIGLHLPSSPSPSRLLFPLKETKAPSELLFLLFCCLNLHAQSINVALKEQKSIYTAATRTRWRFLIVLRSQLRPSFLSHPPQKEEKSLRKYQRMSSIIRRGSACHCVRVALKQQQQQQQTLVCFSRDKQHSWLMSSDHSDSSLNI